MKNSVRIILILGLAILLQGCGQTDLGNTYHEGTDHQYMYDNYLSCMRKQAIGENGYFLYYNNFLYYLDRESKELVPLCNRVDCLHDAETDMDRRVTCNAYVGAERGSTYPQDVGISYSDGYLYFITQSVDEHTYLQRIKEDGTAREKIYDFGVCIINGWCIHRGVLYYSEQVYTEEKEIMTIKKLSLTGTKKPRVLYEPDTDATTVYSLGQWLDAYGNYIYFSVVGVNMLNMDEVTNENYTDYAYATYYAYDSANEVLREITASDMSSNEYVSHISFWKDHLVFTDSSWENGFAGKADLYIADLDGSNAEKLMEVDSGTYVKCDDTYLYLSNEGRHAHGDDEDQIYQVYNDDLELVDTFKLNLQPYATVPVGDENGFYFCEENGEMWSLERFDKSRIGSLDGAEMPVEILSERERIVFEE